MKKIEAIIKPFKLEAVKAALDDIGIHGLTVTEVKGCGRQKGNSEIYKSSEYSGDYLPKIKIDVVVQDSLADQTVKAIIESAKTGKVGDGKVFMTSLDQVWRIRTNESGDAAV
jgi:nitrogen regulatory protein PII